MTFIYFKFFWDRVSLNPGWPRLYVVKDGLGSLTSCLHGVLDDRHGVVLRIESRTVWAKKGHYQLSYIPSPMASAVVSTCVSNYPKWDKIFSSGLERLLRCWSMRSALLRTWVYIPSTQVRWLINACDSSSRDLIPSSPLRVPACLCTHPI